MPKSENPNDRKGLTPGQRLVGYIMIGIIALVIYLFFKSGAWVFFSPAR